MDLIPSFSIDHTKLKPGIYISRTDDVNGQTVTTYDIRMKCPNIEPCVDLLAMHTLEHLIATYLRNNDEWKDKVIYWGPMGCLTGCYLILKEKIEPKEVCKLMIDAYQFAADFEGKVPGTAAEECGNYLLHNLTIAKYEAKKYVQLLKTNPCFEYPVK
ncbi:MAG: S-ribosylhomocysteine lyase [Treponema sp.]|uniref:S-ribosylhomocysteine lyase n=1 Tax=Treponema sp. TaxID=166 RepID=UPI00298E4497|nr:S-ribosylhomocysteine lyase [Treponema sp.]MBR5933167.1 S-ribosylhomocysteine lyase [Treponema sp.]